MKQNFCTSGSPPPERSLFNELCAKRKKQEEERKRQQIGMFDFCFCANSIGIVHPRKTSNGGNKFVLLFSKMITVK